VGAANASAAAAASAVAKSLICGLLKDSRLARLRNNPGPAPTVAPAESISFKMNSYYPERRLIFHSQCIAIAARAYIVRNTAPKVSPTARAEWSWFDADTLEGDMVR
jgi:hypothetical protein